MQELKDKLESIDTYACISITGPGDPISMELRESESALVGNAAGCQLRIQDPNVSSHQCLLELRDGLLMLHNWSPDSSTKVNGDAVEEEVLLHAQDQVSFGDYHITFELHGTGLSPRPTTASRQSPDIASMSAPAPPQKTANPESVEESTLAILYAEIGILQRELEQRDQLLASSKAAANPQLSPEADTYVSRSKARIDELLAELKTSDARLSILTDELRALEDLRAAESEEREQMMAWVNDIERRLAQRESEQAAQMETLVAKLETERAERRRLTGAEDSQVLASIRADRDGMHDQLATAKAELAQLAKDYQELQDAGNAAAIEQRVQEALRAERLQLAEERAEISRREHELSSQLNSVESGLLDESQPAASVDQRIQVFRQQMKEMKKYEPQRQPKSVGKRLVDLWQSLDGPTDRDY